MTDKRAKFVTLAEKRVNRALNDLRLIGNLANHHNYDYSDADAKRIISALESEIKNLKQRFSSIDGDEKPTFKL